MQRINTFKSDIWWDVLDSLNSLVYWEFLNINKNIVDLFFLHFTQFTFLKENEHCKKIKQTNKKKHCAKMFCLNTGGSFWESKQTSQYENLPDNRKKNKIV